ncbi:Hpt domain-containing protein [Pseudoduganella violaceinigra]|uniref:Hpt domain-containing protein n=1 Tax=Pseudoduganella violaceinigra TaxID=246602 RepID=UPI000401A4EE|nr:Hpt domain-containing protein [Pseudoduganella violaceinigra]
MSYASAPDEAIFCVDKLLDYMGHDAKAMKTVVKIVRDGIGPGVEPLNMAGEAIRDAKFMEARRILHTLRGSIGNLGAKRFVAASLALELALQEGRIVEIPRLFTAVEGELKLVHDHAGAWLDQHSGRAVAR